MNSQLDLILHLKSWGYLKSIRIVQAMEHVDRKYFMHEHENPYDDVAQFACGVNISAPHTHALALENLKEHLHKGHRALDVGFGSGYMTACMAVLVGDHGMVTGIDNQPELLPLAKTSLMKTLTETRTKLDVSKHGSALGERHFDNVKLVTGDGRMGYEANAPYDAIYIGASVAEVPIALLNQLKPGGRIFMPMDGFYQVVDKSESGQLTYTRLVECRDNIDPLSDPKHNSIKHSHGGHKPQIQLPQSPTILTARSNPLTSKNEPYFHRPSITDESSVHRQSALATKPEPYFHRPSVTSINDPSFHKSNTSPSMHRPVSSNPSFHLGSGSSSPSFGTTQHEHKSSAKAPENVHKPSITCSHSSDMDQGSYLAETSDQVVIKDYVYTKNDLLGKGKYGTVFRGRRMSDGLDVAIKRIKSMPENSEWQILEVVRNPYILCLLDHIFINNELFVVTELCDCDLRKFLHEAGGRFSMANMQIVAHQLSRGYMALFSADIIHRDIKPANILIEKLENGARLKLADFGCGKILDKVQYAETIVGASGYLAPEVILRRYDARADIFSMGLVLYECYFGDRLEQTMSDIEQGLNFQSGDQSFDEFLEYMLKYQPKNRMTPTEFFGHKFHGSVPNGALIKVNHL